MTCGCISPDCPTIAHVDLECAAPGTVTVKSRDWDAQKLVMCAWCAKSARMSGIFEGVK